MTTVRQLLDQKGRNIWSIHPDATVFDAIAKMAEKDIGSLVVMEGDEFVGIITERHYARNVVLKGKTSPSTRPLTSPRPKKPSSPFSTTPPSLMGIAQLIRRSTTAMTMPLRSSS
jgi:CBS domain-containing protein